MSNKFLDDSETSIDNKRFMWGKIDKVLHDWFVYVNNIQNSVEFLPLIVEI